MQNAKPIRWFTFIVLVIGGGTVFKLSSLKDAFYVPMQEFMNLSNTQIGLALSVYGIVQTVGNFASIYIADRFSKKNYYSFFIDLRWLGGNLYFYFSFILWNFDCLGFTFFVW